MKKLVICKTQVEGFHRWAEAFDDVVYLRSRHRHVFQIEMGISVQRNDREVEIIDTQNKIKSFLFERYGVESKSNNVFECEFDNMSCEDIAEALCVEFNAYYVRVTEDGFGGAEVIND